ncbi:MAG: hypothetical protein KC609_11095 [Myxococcales bacterium]|nr:hypothetical protein [Myxococcales bacterium]
MLKLDKDTLEQVIAQAKAIATNPTGIWDDVAQAEYDDIAAIFYPWVFALAVAQGAFVMLGSLILVPSAFGVWFFKGLFGTVIRVIGTVFISGFIANSFVEKVDGKPDLSQAMRLVAFAYTPIAAVHVLFILMRFIPGIVSWLLWAGGFGGFVFLLFSGCVPTMAVPDEFSKRIVFALVTAIPYWLIMPF